MAYRDVDWEAVTAAQVACMNDQGWAVELNGPTALELPVVPAAQQASMEEDFDACTKGLQLPDFEAPSQATIVEFYEALLDTKECLEELGYDIETPPSLEAFIDSFATGPWHPYLSLPILSESELGEVEAECPQP